jgi:hypothetical protein
LHIVLIFLLATSHFNTLIGNKMVWEPVKNLLETTIAVVALIEVTSSKDDDELRF